MDIVIVGLIVAALVLIAINVVQARTISLAEAATACLAVALLVWRLA